MLTRQQRRKMMRDINDPAKQKVLIENARKEQENKQREQIVLTKRKKKEIRLKAIAITTLFAIGIGSALAIYYLI